jgi:hypothetical protein
LYYPSHHYSVANHRCSKCIQVRYPSLFRLDDGWFSRFGGHWIFEFVLQVGCLRIKVVAKVIILTF